MKSLIPKTVVFVLLSFSILLILACHPAENKTNQSILIEINEVPSDLKTISVSPDFFDAINHAVQLKNDSIQMMTSPYLCENNEMPRFLKDLNRNEIYSSNVFLETNTSLQAYGFSGKMGKKDVLIIAYLTKFKDYNCAEKPKRAQIGLKLYVHASDVKVRFKTPSLPLIAAATELGLAKAEYRFETFGINPGDFYSKLPSAQFTVDTYSKVISAYDEIVHSLKDSTEIDPIIIDSPEFKP